MTAAQLDAVFAALRPGDVVEVTFAGEGSSPDRRRSVRVESRNGRSVFVGSGAVRPGHVAGGVLTRWDDGIVYQPTLQQRVRPVRALLRAPSFHRPEVARA